MANDIITHVDGEATRGMTLNKTLEKMRGPVNTEVRLRIARKGQDAPIELTIVRAPIRAASGGAGADVQVTVRDGKLQIEASGALPVLDFEKGALTTLVPLSSNEFLVDGGDHTRLGTMAPARRRAWCSIRGLGRSLVTGSTERDKIAHSTNRSRMLRRALRISSTVRRSVSEVIRGSMLST